MIARCTSFTGEDGTTRILDDNTRANIEVIKDQWSSQGKRVLLLARKVLPQHVLRSSPSSTDFELEISKHSRSDLTLIGLVGIVDPPVSRPTFAWKELANFLKRSEIPEVVRILRRAGIRLFMVRAKLGFWFCRTSLMVANFRSLGISSLQHKPLLENAA